MPCITQQTLTDPKELKRQRARERYAQMDKNKKDEINKKRREAYHRKKTHPFVHSQEAQPITTPAVPTQLQNMPISKGAFEHGPYF